MYNLANVIQSKALKSNTVIKMIAKL